jgi:G3E family GTPase
MGQFKRYLLVSTLAIYAFNAQAQQSWPNPSYCKMANKQLQDNKEQLLTCMSETFIGLADNRLLTSEQVAKATLDACVTIVDQSAILAYRDAICQTVADDRISIDDAIALTEKQGLSESEVKRIIRESFIKEYADLTKKLRDSQSE